MDFPNHRMPELFAQLGLPAAPEAIERFIAAHPLRQGDPPLADAAFWNPAQAAFLREELLDDADWAEVIDELDARLRT